VIKIGLVKWIKSRRLRTAVVAFAAFVVSWKANPAWAEMSTRTKSYIDAARRTYTGMKANDDWSYDSADKLKSQAHKAVLALADDILRDLKAGKNKEAYAGYKKLRELTRLLDALGGFDGEVVEKYELILAAIKAIKKKKDKSVDSVGNKTGIPAGAYVYKGKNFLMKVRVKLVEGGLLVEFKRVGLPLEEGEWAAASAGKPDALNKYLRAKLKKTFAVLD